MLCFLFYMPLIKFANLILLLENNSIFLKYSQFSHLTISKLGAAKRFFQDAPFPRLWVLGFFLQSTKLWVPANTAYPTSITTGSPFILPDAEWGSVWRDYWDNYLGSRNSWYLSDICMFIGLCTCQFPLAPQRSCEPILSETGTEQELNRHLMRPLIQEAKDSPHSHQRGTNL